MMDNVDGRQRIDETSAFEQGQRCVMDFLDRKS